MKPMSLVIPTYRLRDVGDTVNEYAASLEHYGHEAPICVFDDSDETIHRRDFALFCHKTDAVTVLYVGPAEKARFVEELQGRVDARHRPHLARALRPSYGGNRNFTVLYTLTEHFVSVDDDMRPHGLHHVEPETLGERDVLKGTYVDKQDPDQVVRKTSYDLVTAYREVLGKPVKDLTAGRLAGASLVDSMTELYTNVTRGTLEPNTVSLVGGPIRPDATVMTAQTFRSGSADVDAVDYANDFLVNPENVLVNDMALRYVIQAHRPCVTATNWRLDCGISAYDNSNGLPPFLPTTLRFEDYGYRLWLQEPRFAAAHVDAVQTHYRNPYMRAGLAHDLWNEGVANYLKGRLMASLEEVRDTQLVFDGNVEVDRRDTEPIMDTGLRYYRLALRRASEEAEAKKGDLLRRLRMARHFAAFASDLYRWFDGFDLDVFHAHLQHTVASEVADIRTTMGMWPTVLDAALDIRSEGRLPRCTRER